jgi:hypothetical protein
MGKRAGLSVGGKKDMCACKEQCTVLVQANKILQTIYFFYGIIASISQHCVGDSLSEKINGRTKYVKV